MWDWGRYLDLAQDLVRDPRADESHYRCAASRAYYAAFHKARNWLKRNQPDVQFARQADTHKIAWDAYESRPERDSKRIGQEGKRLREIRRKADYEDVVHSPADKALDAVEGAQRIIQSLANL